MELKVNISRDLYRRLKEQEEGYISPIIFKELAKAILEGTPTHLCREELCVSKEAVINMLENDDYLTKTDKCRLEEQANGLLIVKPTNVKVEKLDRIEEIISHHWDYWTASNIYKVLYDIED